VSARSGSPAFSALSDADWPPWPSASVVDRAAIHVLRLWLPDWATWAAGRAAELSLDEQQRAARYLSETVGERFVACRTALRHLLSEALSLAPHEITLSTGPYGKPTLAPEQNPQQLAFNVSHSSDVALIAIGWRCELGVDVESTRGSANWQGIARRFFAPAEWQQVQQLPADLQHAGFYRVWTCKEAYLKGTGRGMSLPLGRFAVCADPRLPLRLLHVEDEPTEPARWHLHALYPADDFAAAVMWDGPATAVNCWTWHPGGA
jgi:4'-phosphopantetheinyl transferase